MVTLFAVSQVLQIETNRSPIMLMSWWSAALSESAASLEAGEDRPALSFRIEVAASFAPYLVSYLRAVIADEVMIRQAQAG